MGLLNKMCASTPLGNRLCCVSVLPPTRRVISMKDDHRARSTALSGLGNRGANQMQWLFVAYYLVVPHFVGLVLASLIQFHLCG
jgi:hypothetical protein